MSKFDKGKARAWVAGPEMGTHKACKYLLAACDYIDAIEAKITVLERIKEAAASVLSEEGVGECLSHFVMGIELAVLVKACSEADREQV